MGEPQVVYFFWLAHLGVIRDKLIIIIVVEVEAMLKGLDFGVMV